MPLKLLNTDFKMGAFRADIEFITDWNETLTGVMFVAPDSHPKMAQNLTLKNVALNATQESDPVGASSFIIAVVLLYGFSIVFMIGSHVVLKPKEIDRDTERQIIKFIEMSPTLQENSKRENWRNLKEAVIPVVAKTPAKDLVTRRKSFLQIIGSALSGSRRGSPRSAFTPADADPGRSFYPVRGADKGLTSIQEDHAEETSDEEEHVFLGHLSRDTISQQNKVMRAQSGTRQGTIREDISLDESLRNFAKTLHTAIDSTTDDDDELSSDAEFLPAITLRLPLEPSDGFTQVSLDIPEVHQPLFPSGPQPEQSDVVINLSPPPADANPRDGNSNRETLDRVFDNLQAPEDAESLGQQSYRGGGSVRYSPRVERNNTCNYSEDSVGPWEKRSSVGNAHIV